MSVEFRSLEWRWANSVRWYLDRLVPLNGERLQSLDVARLVHKIFGVSVAAAVAVAIMANDDIIPDATLP